MSRPRGTSVRESREYRAACRWDAPDEKLQLAIAEVLHGKAKARLVLQP